MRRARLGADARSERRGGRQETKARDREVVVPDVITVQELANRMAERGVEVIKFLMRRA